MNLDGTIPTLAEHGDHGPRTTTMSIRELWASCHLPASMLEALGSVPVQIAKARAPCQRGVKVALFSDSTYALCCNDANAPTNDLQALESS